MNDMTAVIVPKSDQLNSDDLIAGPITITITDVVIRGGQEQPVSIHYEGDNGKPYKSCKSMNRLLVAAWGPDAKRYVGRSMTLYRDPSVKWAGMEVGGIRISHLSHLEAPMTMALTATKGSRKPYTVRPLEVAPQVDWETRIRDAATLAELGEVWKACPDKARFVAAKDARKEQLSSPAPHSADTAPVTEPPTYAEVADLIAKADSMDALDFARSHIAKVADETQQAELNAEATRRAKDIKAGK